MELRLTSITPRPNHMHLLNIKGACMQFFGRRTKRYELDLYLKTSSLLIGFCGTCMEKFTMVFCYLNCSDLLEQALLFWLRKYYEIWGWRPRICKIFEITSTIFSNSERSEEYLVTECFFTSSWKSLIYIWWIRTIQIWV